jgi:hypothetical protein
VDIDRIDRSLVFTVGTAPFVVEVDDLGLPGLLKNMFERN